jgi:hypothetical protein
VHVMCAESLFSCLAVFGFATPYRLSLALIDGVGDKAVGNRTSPQMSPAGPVSRFRRERDRHGCATRLAERLDSRSS